MGNRVDPMQPYSMGSRAGLAKKVEINGERESNLLLPLAEMSRAERAKKLRIIPIVLPFESGGAAPGPRHRAKHTLEGKVVVYYWIQLISSQQRLGTLPSGLGKPKLFIPAGQT